MNDLSVAACAICDRPRGEDGIGWTSCSGPGGWLALCPDHSPTFWWQTEQARDDYRRGLNRAVREAKAGYRATHRLPTSVETIAAMKQEMP